MPPFSYDYPYKKIDSKFLPIIPVEIYYKDNVLAYEALIDSGAGFCIFHAELAPILGIDLKSVKPEEFGGIVAGGVGYVHTVEFRVKGDRYETVCAFSEDINDDGYGILGHIGFFDHFRVKFEYDKKNIELTPVRRK